MLNKNELRLGNLVNEEVLTELTIVGLLGNICRADNKGEDCHLSYDSLIGIPLTEDWLVKHGFFVKNFDYSIPISECKVVWLTLIPQDEECTAYSVCVTQTDEDEEDQNAFLSDISYVHQLQNLYHAMANKELIPKEV